MKPLKVGLIVLIMFIQIFSHSYNQTNSSVENIDLISEDNTVYLSNNNSSGNNSGGNGNTGGGNSSGNNTGNGTNSSTSDAHCLILSNFSITQSNYVNILLVNTCNTAINYPGINASVDHTGVSGLSNMWWYVIGGNNNTGNQSGLYSSYQMGWQLSFNQNISNGTIINLTFQATVLNCGANNSWSNACPNANNSILTYQFQYIAPIPRLKITSASMNVENDQISLSYFTENFSGYVNWEYTSVNGTSTFSSYTTNTIRATYLYPDVFGVIQICGSIPGDTNCFNITRNIRPLFGEILSPANNFTTNDNGIYVDYFAGNYSYGVLEINNQTVHYVQSSNLSINSSNAIYVQLPAGWSTLCLRLTGDNNTLLLDCVDVYKPPPVVRLVIINTNLSTNNDVIILTYRTENFSGTVYWSYTASNGSLQTTSYGNSYQRTVYIYPTVFGLIEVCGTINNSIYECVSFNRSARVLEGSLISPNSNSQYSTSYIGITYLGNNYTNGSITVNGVVYRTLGSQFASHLNTSNETTSVYVGYGSSSICLNLWGENGTYISDCVVVQRLVPNHIVSITYPLNGTTFTGQYIDVNYILQNSSSHYFTLNGVTSQPTNNNNGTNLRLLVGFGTANICLVSNDFAGLESSDCIQLNMLNPNADTDADGVSDQLDLCQNTNQGASVNIDGCATYQLDEDADGVNDATDICPNTQQFSSVNSTGCAAYQRDSDGDNVMDNIDLCPATPPNLVVDSNGCSSSQLDSDNDGVNDDVDICSGTIAGSQVNTAGCSSSQRDTDSDGIVDSFDQCPNTILGTVVDQTGCDFNNSSGGTSNGNSSSSSEESELPGFQATLAIVSISTAFFVGVRCRDPEK